MPLLTKGLFNQIRSAASRAEPSKPFKLVLGKGTKGIITTSGSIEQLQAVSEALRKQGIATRLDPKENILHAWQNQVTFAEQVIKVAEKITAPAGEVGEEDLLDFSGDNTPTR
jgi:hypothetical protein